MYASPVYRSERGKAEVLDLYERELDHLGTPCDSRRVMTRFGETHVLIAGPRDAPPLVLLSGLHAGAPRTLEMFLPLTKDFRVHAPDPVGQPGRSAETRPESAGHEYASWLSNVLDALQLERAAFVGMSFGAAILLDLAAYVPEHIEKAVLIAPAGMVPLPRLELLRQLALPWLLYRLRPDRRHLIQLLRPLAEEPDPTVLALADVTIRNVKALVRPPGPYTAHDLARYEAPTLVLLARNDALVPVTEALQTAVHVLPARNTLLEVYDGTHLPSAAALAQIHDRTLAFLRDG